MQGDANKVKDTQNDVKDTSLSLKDTPISISFNKANKLITALYMVSDIMDIEEPLRKKLRSLGVEVLAEVQVIKDMHTSYNLNSLTGKLDLILSCLNIATTVGMISNMNGQILTKEFSLLKEAIQSTKHSGKTFENEPEIEAFLNTAPRDFLFNPPVSKVDNFHSDYGKSFPVSDSSQRQPNDTSRTRIGVQKGSTLMQALSKVGQTDRISKTPSSPKHKEDFDQLKKERRNEIILIIKTQNLEQSSKGLPLGVTITDIRNHSKAILKDTSEKTLQRELMSLIEEGVLYKEGSKRWSKYFVK